MDEETKVHINIHGNVFIAIKELKAQFGGLTESVKGVERAASTSFSHVEKSIRRIDYAAMVDVARNITDAFGAISEPGLEFQRTVAELSAITGIAGKDLEYLAQTAREVGVSSGLGASQATEAYKLLASQISVDKIGVEGLQTLQEETIKLSQAAGISLPEAANAMASAINQFGLDASEASRVINVLAAGSKYGAAEIPELAASFKASGAAANAAGISIEQLAGATEVLSKNAIKGGEAGMAMRNIILKMQTALGVDFTQTSLSEALTDLRPKLNDVQFLTKTFGMENMAAVQFLIQNAEAVDDMTAKVTGTNVAYEQAAINTNTYAHEIARVKAYIDNVKISLFEVTGPVLPMAEAFSGVAVTISQLLPLFNLLTKAKVLLNAEFYQSIGLMIKENALSAKNIVLKGLQATWTGITTAAQWLLNIAMMANPIGLLIAGIAGLVAGLVWLGSKMGWFGSFFTDFWEGLKEWFLQYVEFFTNYLNPFGWLYHLIDYLFPEAGAAIREWFSSVLDWVIANVVEPLTDLWNGIKLPTGRVLKLTGTVHGLSDTLTMGLVSLPCC